MKLGRRVECTHEQERTEFVEDWRNRSGDDCLRICTRRLRQNRTAVQVRAASSMMNGFWRMMARLRDRRAIAIGGELPSHRRAVEVHHHDAQGRYSDQAVKDSQNGHGSAILFASKRAFKKNVPKSAVSTVKLGE
ncbi:hypothetical protein ASG68_12170 [Rhizobium sp. Leaf453]|nr:hypothetical protein ASG68_12170 [Rhizobium sp. Leaf453]